MKKVITFMAFLILVSALMSCGGEDSADPCTDLGAKWEIDFVKFQGMLDNEAEIRDRALTKSGSNVAAMQSIWKSYNQRSGEIRSTFNEMYANYYKDCNPNAERLK